MPVVFAVALVRIGIGFCTVRLNDPEFVGEATLTAVMVTGFALGIAAGGVYWPLLLIVPVVPLPPGTPFTCHVTLVLLAFVTTEYIWTFDPSLTCVGPVTLTDTCGAVLEGEEEPLAHPKRTRLTALASPRLLHRKIQGDIRASPQHKLGAFMVLPKSGSQENCSTIDL